MLAKSEKAANVQTSCKPTTLEFLSFKMISKLN